MGVGWVEGRNPTPAWVTLSLTHPTNNCASLLSNAQFVALIEHSRARHRSEGGISSVEMRQRLGA